MKRTKTIRTIAIILVLAITIILVFLMLGGTPARGEREPFWTYTLGDVAGRVDISDDAEFMVVGSQDNKVYFFEKENNTPLWNYTASYDINMVAISADGKYIVACVGHKDNGKVYLFHKDSNVPLWSYKLHEDPFGTGQIWGLDISADGEYIAVGSGNDKAYLFDKDSSDPLWSYTCGSNVNSASISRDGEYVVIGSSDERVCLFDKDSNDPIWTYDTGAIVGRVSISGDGEYIAAGAKNDRVYLFDKDSETPQWSYRTGGDIWAVAISSDGEYIAAGSDDHKLYLFDRDSETPLWNYPTGGNVRGVDISTDGEYITAGASKDSENLYFFDKDSSTPIWKASLGDHTNRVSMSADGEYCVASCIDHKVYFFSTRNIRPVSSILTIDPDLVLEGENIEFQGYAEDEDGEIVEYNWRSDIDGNLSNKSSFESSTLSLGRHTIYFKAKDSNGTWSLANSERLTITRKPVASIYSISPNPANDNDTIEFKGNGTDEDGTIETYLWNSSIDGKLYEGDSDTFGSDSLSYGRHNISFKVMDNDGMWSDEVSAELDINARPTVTVLLISEDVAEKGQVVEFQGNGSDADGSIVGYHWRSDIDGNLSSEAEFESSALSAGKHTISFKVKDDNGTWSLEDSDTLTITKEPVAYIDSVSPNPATEDDIIEFQGHGTDEGGTIEIYLWNSSIDGKLYEGDSDTFDSDSLSYGRHNISFKVMDNDGMWSDEVFVELEMNARPTVTMLLISEDVVEAGQVVEFQGEGSDADGSIVGYHWRSDIDGNLSSEAEFGSSALSPGDHTIYFKVKDDNGTWSLEDSEILTITKKPVAYIDSVSPNPATDDDIIEFRGHGTDEGGTIESYLWNSSIDGKLYEGDSDTFDSDSLSYGSHTIFFKVLDDDGMWSDTVSVELRINARPTVTVFRISEDLVEEGQEVEFQGEGSDADGSIVEYQWNSDIDGYLGNDSSFETSTLSLGTHTISFKVKDDNGTWSLEDSGTLAVTRRPVAFIDSISPDPTHDDDTVEFQGRGTDEDGTIEAYLWNSSIDGKLYEGDSDSFEFYCLSRGHHTISLQVMDNDGMWSDTVSVELRINVRPEVDEAFLSEDIIYGGQLVEFQGEGHDVDGIIVEYQWRSNINGFLSSDPRFNSSDLSVGSHTISFKVRDDAGSWSNETSNPLFVHARPRAVIKSISPDPALTDEKKTFSGKGVDDGTISRYFWRSSLNGKLYEGTKKDITVTLLVPGEHTIFLKVKDNNGAWSEEVNTTLVVHERPMAYINVITPNPAVKGEEVSFIGTGVDQDGIFRYLWNSDIDGEIYAGPHDNFLFSQLSLGVHDITFQVMDSNSVWSDKANRTVTIREMPVAVIESISPDPAWGDEEIEFKGNGTADGEIVNYRWFSSLDGELYHDWRPGFVTFGLSPGEHVISLRVQDEYHTWSEEVTASLTVLTFSPPSDFDPSLNPTPLFLTPDQQRNPSIYGDIVTWQDDNNGDWNIFLFDLENSGKVEQITGTSIGGGTYPVSDYTQPLVYEEQIVYQYKEGSMFSYEYTICSYDLGDPQPENKAIVETGRTQPTSLAFSGNWVIWIGNVSIDDWQASYDLHIYDLLAEKEEVFMTVGSPAIAIHDSKLLYLSSAESQGLGGPVKTYMVIYDLDTRIENENFTLGVAIDDIAAVDYDGDHVTWADKRNDGSAGWSVDDPNTDIFFMDVRTGETGQITSEESPQKNPRVQGDYIVWEDMRSGDSSIYAYSISRNKQAILCENGSTLLSPDVHGNWVVWEHERSWSNSVLVLFDMRKADWTASEATFSDSSSGAGDGDGGGGKTSYYSVSNRYFMVPGFLIMVGLCIAGILIGKVKKLTGIMAVGLVLILLGAVLGVALVPLTADDGEDYDAWLKEAPGPGESITVGAFIQKEEEIMPGTMYQYHFEGSESPFLSGEDIGDEGDFVIVNIEINALGVPETKEKKSAWVTIVPGLGMIIVGVLLVFSGSKRTGPGKQFDPGGSGKEQELGVAAEFDQQSAGILSPAKPHQSRPPPPLSQLRAPEGSADQQDQPRPHQQQAPPPLSQLRAPAGSADQQDQPRPHQQQAPPPDLATGSTEPQFAQEAADTGTHQIPQQVQCPKCLTVIPVDPTRITPEGDVEIRCPGCGTTGGL